MLPLIEHMMMEIGMQTQIGAEKEGWIHYPTPPSSVKAEKV